jgi:hypothetical protein
MCVPSEPERKKEEEKKKEEKKAIAVENLVGCNMSPAHSSRFNEEKRRASERERRRRG